jgi:hypothetical protein
VSALDEATGPSYDQPVTKQQQGVPMHYPCLTQKDGLRRVHEPHEERIVTQQGRLRLRRALSKLVRRSS